MNWKRGFLRLGIVAVFSVILPLGGIVYADWREQQAQQQLLRLDAATSRYLYEKFVHELQAAHGMDVPDARIISRAQIPMSAWPPWWRLAAIFGAAGFVLGLGSAWVIAGFREK